MVECDILLASGLGLKVENEDRKRAPFAEHRRRMRRPEVQRQVESEERASRQNSSQLFAGRLTFVRLRAKMQEPSNKNVEGSGVVLSGVSVYVRSVPSSLILF